MTAQAISELEGLRALARSLVHGDAEADDLLQDAAVATLEHPPAIDRPLRPWLATVIRNRWRMNRRAAARRQAREEAVAPVVDENDVDPIDRARALQRLSEALVALAEPFRETVIKRYLDGQTAAEIARACGVPAGTVRWRLKTGLERLRAVLDASQPRWKRALVPLPIKGALLVKAKTQLSIVIVVVLLLLGGLWIGWWRGSGGGSVATRHEPARAPIATPAAPSRAAAPPPAHAEPNPGQGRAAIEQVALAGGAASGRVINWSTGEGVAGADLTFTGDDGATTVHSRDDGGFELATPAPGIYALTAIAATGFLPYAPEYLHSAVRVETTRDRAVRGLTVFLFPALDYHGRVVDETGAPIANAKVKLLGTPAGEQVIDRLQTEWTTDRAGAFTFHAADDAVLEAAAGERRGWGRLDGDVAITKHLVIKIGKAAARDATITGRVVDGADHPLADVLVRADPENPGRADTPRATMFATTNAEGTFEIRGLDRDLYALSAEAEDHAPVTKHGLTGGTHDVALVLTAGETLGGSVVTADGAPAPSFTLLVFRRNGAARELVTAKSFISASGHFEVRAQAGTYDLIANATGWAPSAMTTAKAPASDIKLTVSAGATLTGDVRSSVDNHPIPYARVMREAASGGASAQPANAGTVTRADGTFELTGIPPGAVSVSITADQFSARIEAGMIATDGAKLGPLSVTLSPVVDGEPPKLELVGIGVALVADGDALRVDRVIPNSGAEAAGIVAGDHVVAVDGTSAAELGVAGAVARIRGAPHTTVSISLARGGQVVTLVVERRKIQA